MCWLLEEDAFAKDKYSIHVLRLSFGLTGVDEFPEQTTLQQSDMDKTLEPIQEEQPLPMHDELPPLPEELAPLEEIPPVQEHEEQNG